MQLRELAQDSKLVKEIITNDDSNGNNDLPPGWEKMIKDADARARKLVGHLSQDFEQVFRQDGKKRKRKRKRVAAWKKKNKLMRWLGWQKLTNDQFKNIRRRIGKIKNRLDNGIKYSVMKEQSGKGSHGCHQKNGGNNAYVRPSKKIHLCPNWFTENTPDEQAAIIVHEIVHKLGLFGKRHYKAKNATDARNLARSKPKRARRSPENYEHLILEYK